MGRNLFFLKLRETAAGRDPRARSIVNDDTNAIADLFVDAYRGTIDDEGGGIEEAIAEVRATLNGVYGKPMLDCSFTLGEQGRLSSISIVTDYAPLGGPLLAFVATRGALKRTGLARIVLEHTIHQLWLRGVKDLRAVVTEGNTASEALLTKLGFERVPSAIEGPASGRG